MLAYKHILIATDLEPETFELIETARSVAPHAKVSLIHAIPPVGFNYGGISAYIPDMEYYEKVQTELLASKREHVNEMIEYHGLENVTWDIEVGKPAKTIKDYAAKHGVDLIILGSHGETGLKEILGTTARGVLNGAPCDVLTAHLPPKK